MGGVNEILTLNEASEYLRIKGRTMYSLASRGVVPGIKVGGQWRFKRDMLDALFDRAQLDRERSKRSRIFPRATAR